jgi:hypothetical protein
MKEKLNKFLRSVSSKLIVRFWWNSAHDICINAVHRLCVSRKSQQVRLYFSYGCNLNHIYAGTVKPYGIQKAKNAVVNSVYYVSE